MNKRGTHVEIIISFIIFIAFIIFIFSTIKSPISKQEDKKNIFEGIQAGIIDRVSSDMTTAVVELGAGVGNCVNLNNIISDLGIGTNIVVKDYLGESVQSSVSGSSLNINRVRTSDTLFKIYYSTEFPELATSSACSVIGSETGLTKTNKYVFESNFVELVNEDYLQIKNDLNVPNGVNFSYGLIRSDGTILERAQGELSTNMYVQETPVEYVDLQGSIKEGYLKTIIW
jgi:hypothetical protein